MPATEYVILVDDQDQEIGTAEKMLAHQKNQRHRAFSIFLFQGADRILLQQRALGKYHSPGLWTNACCSHPQPGEDLLVAGQRRLQYELGITTSLKNIGWFHYIAHFANGLSENENDHVLVGEIMPEVRIMPNPEEVLAYRWVTLAGLEEELKAHPQQFTPWFAEAYGMVKKSRVD